LEFHCKDSESGLRYWCVTGSDDKGVYDPDAARERVECHARHFVSALRSQMAYAKASGVQEPIVVAPYDAELFGHWWHEGVDWMDRVIRCLANDSDIETMTLGDFDARERSGRSTIAMGPSSWGENGDFTVWTNPEHSWVWPIINASSREFELAWECVRGSSGSIDARGLRIARQAARELLLMQASDWPFLLHTRQAKEYANQRFHHHHQRLRKLLWAMDDLHDIHRLTDADLVAMQELDCAWPELDPELFREP